MMGSTDMSEVRCCTCTVRRHFVPEDLHNRASQDVMSSSEMDESELDATPLVLIHTTCFHAQIAHN
jgi:hypothetical protein